jgi:hypothetical protein
LTTCNDRLGQLSQFDHHPVAGREQLPLPLAVGRMFPHFSQIMAGAKATAFAAQDDQPDSRIRRYGVEFTLQGRNHR